MNDQPQHVFVSYTHDQEQVAGALVDQLRVSGASPSTVEDSGPGSDWRAELNGSIADADSFVVVIGNDPSRNDRAEWTAVLEESWADPDKPLVAILTPDATLPAAFADRQAITLDKGENVAEQVAHLVPEIFAAFRVKPDQSSSLDPTWGRRLDEIQFASQAIDDEPDRG